MLPERSRAPHQSPKGRASSCRRSLKGSTPPKMWESSHCNTMRISEITPRKRYVLACELQKCQWGLPADRICFHKLSFVCFALRSYCEYVLHICITQIPGEYRINFISLLILLILLVSGNTYLKKCQALCLRRRYVAVAEKLASPCHNVLFHVHFIYYAEHSYSAYYCSHSD